MRLVCLFLFLLPLTCNAASSGKESVAHVGITFRRILTDKEMLESPQYTYTETEVTTQGAELILISPI
jgi:hypothetical protein